MLVREVCDAITLSRENRLLSILAGITVLLTLGFGICIRLVLFAICIVPCMYVMRELGNNIRHNPRNWDSAFNHNLPLSRIGVQS